MTQEKKIKIGPGVYAVGPLGQIVMTEEVRQSRIEHGLSVPARCCNKCGHAFEPVCIYDLTCPDCQKAHAERVAKITFTRQEYVDQLAAEEAEERDRQDEISFARDGH